MQERGSYRYDTEETTVVDVTGDYEFMAPPEVVWEAFLDPELLARVMPGCERLEQIGEHEYEGVMKIRVGPVQGDFRGTVQLGELKPPHSYHMTVNGRGPAGIVRGEGDVQLQATDSGTRLEYSGQAQISGRIATVGQRLMESSANAIARQSLENLDKQIAAKLRPAARAGEEEEAAAPAPAPAPPGQTEFALGVAREVVEDLLPAGASRQLLTGGAFLIMLALLLDWHASLVARRLARLLEEE